MKDTIMVMCAHSDDEILGPGATLAKYAQQGKKIITVIFSYGALSMPHFKKEIAVKTRVDEAKAADKIIKGSGVLFLGLSETKLKEELIEKHQTIINLIQKYQPSKIFTHSIDDPHPNHRAVYRAVIKALDKLEFQPEVYTFDVWNPINFRKRSYPKLYVDVSGTFNTKLRALACFESQFSVIGFMNFLPWIIMYIKALIYGIKINSKYAERFFKIK